MERNEYQHDTLGRLSAEDELLLADSRVALHCQVRGQGVLRFTTKTAEIHSPRSRERKFGVMAVNSSCARMFLHFHHSFSLLAFQFSGRYGHLGVSSRDKTSCGLYAVAVTVTIDPNEVGLIDDGES
jgi:hypothetical protein